jgi:hypothetical protein
MMWQRMALCVAGWGAITVSVALADETTPTGNQHAPPDAFVAYLDDDPPAAEMPVAEMPVAEMPVAEMPVAEMPVAEMPAAEMPAAEMPVAEMPVAEMPAAQTTPAQTPAAQAAGRVLRMLQVLGVHRPQAPQALPGPVFAATDLPSPRATEAALLQTAAAVGYQEDAGRSVYEADTPADAGGFRIVPPSPDSSAPNEGWASSWPINNLRDPAGTHTDLLQAGGFRDRGLRDRVEPETDTMASTGEADGSPTRPLAGSAMPVSPILCPDGMKSSRRTVRHAAPETNVAQAATAEPPALIHPAASEPLTTAMVPAPAYFDPSSQAAPSLTSQPPLPPLPPLRSDKSFMEPRSIDAVLEPRPIVVVKSPPAARDGADVELAKTSDNVEFKPTAMPSPQHRSPALPAPELPPQRVAASGRQPSRVAGGPARGAMLSPLPNALRDLPSARTADLPRQIALQSPPQAAPRLAPAPVPQTQLPQTQLPQTQLPQTQLPQARLTPLRTQTSPPTLAAETPPQTLPPLPPQLPSLQPRPTAELAAAEPALLRVAVRESRLLRTPENVVRVVSEHDSICDVLLFNPREIAVVGKQRGQAKVEFWYDGQGLNRVSYLVAVDDERTPETQGRTDLPKMERLVAYLFPNSRVKLISDRGRLIVRGSATSQREAVEIVSTVRRSQLVPVTDEIVVQPAAK